MNAGSKPIGNLAAKAYTVRVCKQQASINMSKWGRMAPVLLLWLDMAYGFALNVLGSLALSGSNLPKDGLPVAPEIAFNGLQVLANGGMILIVSWGFWCLWQLSRSVARQQPWPIGVLRALGLATVLAFSLPSWWHWLWALWDLLHGNMVVAWHNPRYLVVALLMPYPAALCLRSLYRHWRHRPQNNAVETAA